MEFSFNGSLDELKAWAALITRGDTDQPEKGMPITEVPEAPKAAPIVAASAEEDKSELNTAPADQPAMHCEAAPAPRDPIIDPTTGEYYTAFADMVKALDALMAAKQDDDVIALLKINSVNGEYGGVPASKWGAVEKNAKALLKKSKPKKEKPAITLDQLKQKAVKYVQSDKDANKPKLKELLHTFDVDNINYLKESDFEAFNEGFEALTGGAA